MDRPHRSDRSTRGLVRFRMWTAARRHRHDSEKGQTTVEFALILIPLLLLVVGIIQFGIALNYWLDMNRLSNQGARMAVVNAWPNCPQTQLTDCTATSVGPSNSLATWIKSQATSRGLQGNVTVTVCYPDDGDASTVGGEVGSPVKVQVDSPYTFRAIMKLGTLNLRARTTMRIEYTEPVNHLGTGIPSC